MRLARRAKQFFSISLRRVVWCSVSRKTAHILVVSAVALSIAVLPEVFSTHYRAVAQDVKPTGPDTEESLAQGALQEAKVPNPGDTNIKHGQDVVLGKISCAPGQTCYPCFTCHQIRGEGSASSEFPRLTGQAFRYLYTSLKDYASGARKSDVMEPVAKALSNDDMRDVAAYYAGEELAQSDMAKWAAAKNSPASDMLTEGAALAAIGSAKRGVQACANCHGPAGAGLPPVYPYLAGQYAGYLEAQLKAFKSGSRKESGLQIMTDIARRLSDDDIHSVAEYYASIRPPVTVPQTSFAGPLQIGAPLGPAQNGNQQNTSQGQSTSQGNAQ